MLRAGRRRIQVLSLCSSRISWLASIFCSYCIGRGLEEVNIRVFEGFCDLLGLGFTELIWCV